jgi:hypothetical protein
MTEAHDRLVASAYARHAGPASGHPDEEAWVRLAAHELPPDETQALADHLARCSDCGQIYRALADLQQGARAFDPAVPAQPHTTARPNVLAWGGGLAAAAVVAWVMVRPLPPPVSPPPASTEVRGGAEAAVPVRPVGALTARPAVFEWRPAADARAYRVQLLDAQGENIWSSAEVTATTVTLPADLVLRPGRHYWQVLAVPAGGGQISASPMADFDVPR